MSDTYRYMDADGDVAFAQAIQEGGPTVWLQTTVDGCYVQVARLPEFINVLQSAAMDAAHAVRQNCQVAGCSTCSADTSTLDTPEIVVLCGSTEFMDEFVDVNRQETAAGRIVLSVGCNMKEPHPLWENPADAEALKPVLDDLHKAKIRMAERVIVVGTRVGTSTRSEIAYARELGKPVSYIHPEVEQTL